MTDPTRRGFLRRLAGVVAAVVAAPIVGKVPSAAPAEGRAEFVPALRVGRLANGVNGVQIGDTVAWYADPKGTQIASGADYAIGISSNGFTYDPSMFPTVWSGPGAASVSPQSEMVRLGQVVGEIRGSTFNTPAADAEPLPSA